MRNSAQNVMLAGDSVEVQCDATYVLSSTSSATANCETSGEYDHDVAVCVAVCPAHPPVKHGKLSVTGTTAEGLQRSPGPRQIDLRTGSNIQQ